MVGNEIEESAKAAQEVAKTVGKGLDLSRDLGRFFTRIFGGALDQVGGMIEDSLRFRRGVRLLRLEKRYEEIREELGIRSEPTPIEMNIGIPLLEAASLQENDEIQDLYARLLVNATDPSARVKAQRGFVTILQDLGPLEVLLLDRIYSAAGGPSFGTADLPNALLRPEDVGRRVPTDEVALALWNLARLGCIEPAGSSVAVVTLTGLGRALVEACTRIELRAVAEEQTADSWDARVQASTSSDHL
jgi:Abortive infection alpha